MTKENYTEYIILGFLNHQPLSGYLIKKYVERSISYFWKLSNGQIYPTLSRLEKSGYVSMKKLKSSKGPDSKVYSLTDEGRQKLIDWLLKPVSDETFRSPLLLKLFFGAQVPKELTLKNLREYLKQSQGHLTFLELFEKNIEGRVHESPDHMYMYLTVIRGKLWYTGNIKWAKEAIRMLKSS